MNENIVHFINEEAYPENVTIFERRLSKGSSCERQRMKIINELIELYDTYDLIGSEQITDKIFSHFQLGEYDLAFALYEKELKDTKRGELADVIIATLTLKAISQDPRWCPQKHRAPYGISFIKMIGLVAEFISADSILDWCVAFANSNGIDIAPQIRIKLMYNSVRKDWPNP